MEKLSTVFKIEYTKGDTYALAIKFKNITEDLRTAYLSVKENPEDSTPLIQKSLGKGISKIDDRGYKNEKTYKFQLQPADTVNLEPKVQYLYDIQVTVGNVVKTVLHGVFVLNSTITGTGGVTTPTLEVEIDDELETELETTPATDGVEYEQDPVACAKIGDLSTLSTSNKDTVVKAINEVKKATETNATNIANANAEITKIKNGETVVNKAENATTATNANIAQYASEDTSKGTIEERLTSLGFRQGELVINTSILTSETSITLNTLKRQGNYVIGDLKISTSKTGTNGIYSIGSSGQELQCIKIPQEFMPIANTSIKAFIKYLHFNTSTISSNDVYNFIDISVTNDGYIPIPNKAFDYDYYYVKTINIHFGYEAEPLT